MRFNQKEAIIGHFTMARMGLLVGRMCVPLLIDDEYRVCGIDIDILGYCL